MPRSRTGRTSRRSAGRRRCRRPRSSRRASSWWRPSTIFRSTGSCSQAAITCSVPLRRRLDGAWRTTGRSRSAGGGGVYSVRSIPGGTTSASGHPADRVVGADDPRAGLLRPGELLGRLAADVRAEEVHHGLLPRGAQERELQGFRHERQPEVEVEDVGLRSSRVNARHWVELLPGEPAAPVERLVGLGVELVPLEDDEPRVDPAAPERQHVLPRDAGRVDRAVRDPGAVLFRNRHAFGTPRVTSSGFGRGRYACVRVLPLGWVGARDGGRYGVVYSSHSTWSKYRRARRVGRMRDASAPSSSSEISPSACFTPRYGRFRSSW